LSAVLLLIFLQLTCANPSFAPIYPRQFASSRPSLSHSYRQFLPKMPRTSSRAVPCAAPCARHHASASHKRAANQISTDGDGYDQIEAQDDRDKIQLREILLHNQRILTLAHKQRLPSERLKLSEEGFLTIKPGPPGEDELKLWTDLVMEFDTASESRVSAWRPLFTMAERIVQLSRLEPQDPDDQFPYPEEVTDCIIKCYADHLNEVFPAMVLKAIIQDDPDGVMGKHWKRGECRDGHITIQQYLDSVAYIGGREAAKMEFFICLQQEDMPKSFARGRLDRVEVEKVPAIVGYHLHCEEINSVRVGQQLYGVMAALKRKFGYYAEFDWDQFGLGIRIGGIGAVDSAPPAPESAPWVEIGRD
ncbi:hypothetical protein QBC34DRAFT_463088, partial [Podospora aff. communis PSN243]